MNESYLLAFHLGPIQDFIATARRTQDLWMGSWLLAHLTETAIETAMSEGADLVLPKELIRHSDPAIADTPNHFMARYQGADPEQMAQAVESAVSVEWQRIASAVRDVFFNAAPYTVDNNLWSRQINNFLEIYWVLVPDDGSTGSRNRAQAALDARKRLRDFVAVEEEHLKCTLCGVRQELSGSRARDDARKWWVAVVGKHLNRGHLLKLRIREDGSERLCAVCVVKRAAVASQQALPQLQKTNGSFPSTSSVAAAMFKKHLLETGKANNGLGKHLETLEAMSIPAKIEAECVPKLASLKTTLSSDVREKLLTFDGDLFYVETFTEKRLREEYPEGTAEFAEYAAASLRELYREADVRPSKYFAVLAMDGDHMGRFFGKATEKEAQDLSQQMSEFARTQVKGIVEDHYGRVVYAGGDDVLALLPLERALSCAQALQESFKQAVSRVQTNLERPTPSIGIAIAHHTQPLDATLTAMREAEKDAKNKYGRDALCLYVLKRSGEEVHVGAHWQAGGEDTVTVVTEVIELLNQKALSMKFPTIFKEEARFLPTEAIQAELRRLGRRQSGEQFEQHEQAVEEWLRRAATFAAAIGAEEFADWTLLARFIASGGRDEE